MKKISVLLAEDHAFTRQMLEYELKNSEGIDFIKSFDNGASVVDFIKKQQADVIVMDIDMPEMDGIEATKQIKQFNSDISIIILTSHDDKSKVFGSFKSGANAYCVKKIQIEELLKVIQIVYNGGTWFDKSIAGFIYDIFKDVEDEPENETDNTAPAKKTLEDFKITKRERNILKLIADGYTNAQIADELVISLSTVKNHVASIINKLSLKDRTQIAIYTIKNDLLR